MEQVLQFFRRWPALVFARLRLKARALLDGLVYLPLVIPEIVMAVELVIFFSFLRLNLSLWTVIIAHISFCICYVIIVVEARRRSLDPGGAGDFPAAGFARKLRVYARRRPRGRALRSLLDRNQGALTETSCPLKLKDAGRML